MVVNVHSTFSLFSLLESTDKKWQILHTYIRGFGPLNTVNHNRTGVVTDKLVIELVLDFCMFT